MARRSSSANGPPAKARRLPTSARRSGDAAFLTGLERNSDVVVMSAYAPLFVNVNPGGMQWSSDLIGYDALNSYGSPSYYAQVMFASCLGDHTLNSSAFGRRREVLLLRDQIAGQALPEAGERQFHRAAGQIALNGAGAGTHAARIDTLKANTTWATNTITHPERIVPVKSTTSIKGERMQHVDAGIFDSGACNGSEVEGNGR